MDKRVVWIRLQQAFGPGSPKPVYLARRFPGGGTVAVVPDGPERAGAGGAAGLYR